jgi:hypothetical protein
MNNSTIDALLIGVMESIASDKVGNLLKKIHQESWGDLTKEEQKLVRWSLKEAVDLIKSRANYHLFDRYN